MLTDEPPKRRGNPNIAEVAKNFATGPKTDDGKLKVLLSSRIPLYKETPLLSRVRVCDKCPLGQREETLRINDKVITRTRPAQCSFYEKGKTTCVVPVPEWVEKVKVFWALEENTFDLHRALILEAVRHSKTSEEIEVLKKGHPGFYTKEYLELALKSVTEYNKIVSQQPTNRSSHLHIHQQAGDLAERIVQKLFPEDSVPLGQEVPSTDTEDSSAFVDILPVDNPNREQEESNSTETVNRPRTVDTTPLDNNQ